MGVETETEYGGTGSSFLAAILVVEGKILFINLSFENFANIWLIYIYTHTYIKRTCKSWPIY